jgi:hypothetical protein
MIKITDEMMARVMRIKMERAKKIHSDLSEKYNKDSITERIDYLTNVPSLSEIFLAVCVSHFNVYLNVCKRM